MNYLKISLIVIFTVMHTVVWSQKDTIKLKEIVVSGNRIAVPFSESSRSIEVITAEMIKAVAATNTADLLQHVAGVDIRRRGIDGMQSDLYIRGGNFEQTLLLIDGIKMDDAQTGHHTMNAILSLDNIERIEIIKGPAARIYGQNAFTGAVNIITKKIKENELLASVGFGSFDNKKASVAMSHNFDNAAVFANVGYQKSDGYRHNTDFENKTLFLKGSVGSIDFIGSFAERKFGANGFYASPKFVDQYEETQTSLLGVSTDIFTGSFKIMPRAYWRRNQDMYLFIRQNPAYYRNLHITNKMGVETNVVFESSLGKTGIGIDIARSFIVSNNLGDHQRTAITGFFEQRFDQMEKFDVTLGVAVSSFSDFDTQFLPGFDIGYSISDDFKLFGNIGYTYRVPTYTDLYYVGSTTLGNPDLQPESAVSQELGAKYLGDDLQITFALFNRNSEDLIDWTKENMDDKWQTQNFSQVATKGFDVAVNYQFDLGKYAQGLNVSYSYINDEINDTTVDFTRYSLNSLKHQFNTGLNTRFSETLSQNISYRYVERTDGESYNVLDAKVVAHIKDGFELSLTANNILNAEYTETNLVPMPKGNVLIGLKYRIY
ncbi:MAG: TonB-dependent receptor [Flavobacteriaceae bacterium]|nr:MAG: TonB-dependent receptor [Flavobacteriaceae bacterium]